MPKKTILNYLDAFITVICISVLFVVMLYLTPFILAATAIFAVFSKREKLLRYAKNVWLGLDNFFSAMLGGHWEDTLSSRLGKALEAGSVVLSFIARRVDNLWFVALNQLNHCVSAIELRNNKHQVTGR